MSDELIEARAFYRLWNDDVAVFLVSVDERGRRVGAGVSVTFEEREPGMMDPEPTFTMTMEAAQRMAGALWDAGIRPAHAKSGDEQKRHLEDMRALAFAKLGVEKP